MDRFNLPRDLSHAVPVQVARNTSPVDDPKVSSTHPTTGWPALFIRTTGLIALLIAGAAMLLSGGVTAPQVVPFQTER